MLTVFLYVVAILGLLVVWAVLYVRDTLLFIQIEGYRGRWLGLEDIANHYLEEELGTFLVAALWEKKMILLRYREGGAAEPEDLEDIIPCIEKYEFRFRGWGGKKNRKTPLRWLLPKMPEPISVLEY